MADISPPCRMRITNEEYHDSDGLSKSGLDKLAISPAHYQAYKATETKATPAMVLGSLIHTATLEPHLLPEEYAVEPVVDKRTTVGKKVFAEFDAANKGKRFITGDQLALSMAISMSVCTHPIAGKLLAKKGIAEESFYWTDAETGTLCKCRPDYLTEDGILIDIKSTEDASPTAFAKSSWKYRYHVQAAFYTHGVEAVTGIRPKAFIFIAVEKNPPYAVACYMADSLMMSYGIGQARQCIQLFDQCTKSGVWRGYAEEIMPLSIPAWAD